jgi:plastocyanin
MQKNLLLILGILLVAVGVTVLAFQMSKRSGSVMLTPTPTISSGVNQLSTAPTNTSSTVQKLLKIMPKNNASQAVVTAFFAEVTKVAVATNSVDITGCSLNPPVVKVKKGSTLVFKNRDSVTHKLDYRDWNLTVLANEQAELKITGSGVQGYSCDGGTKNSSVGLIYIVE